MDRGEAVVVVGTCVFFSSSNALHLVSRKVMTSVVSGMSWCAVCSSHFCFSEGLHTCKHVPCDPTLSVQLTAPGGFHVGSVVISELFICRWSSDVLNLFNWPNGKDDFTCGVTSQESGPMVRVVQSDPGSDSDSESRRKECPLFNNAGSYCGGRLQRVGLLERFLHSGKPSDYDCDSSFQ